MIRGAQSLAEQTARQRRGGLTTLARLGGEAMTAPARAGFRKRFEQQALELATAQGRTLSPRQLDETATALLRAHMAMMTERRMQKRYEIDATERCGDRHDRFRQHPQSEPHSVEELMAEAEQKALGDDARDRIAIQRVAEPVRLCIGCWLEMWPTEAFPAAASSTLCLRHLESYRLTMMSDQPSDGVGHDTQTEVTTRRGAAPPKQSRQKQRQTRRAPVLEHERSRDLNHRSVHQSH